MSDIEKWKWFPLSVASSLIPGIPHPATVVRWALKGVKAGPNGERVKLATRKVGGRRYTNRALIEEFIARLNATDSLQGVVSQRREESVAQAEQEMDAEGII